MKKFYPLPTSFASRLAKALSVAGITQAELSKRSGIAESTISRWRGEHGQTPRRGTILQLANALGVHPSELLPNANFEHDEQFLRDIPLPYSAPQEDRNSGSHLLDKMSTSVLLQFGRELLGQVKTGSASALPDLIEVYELILRRHAASETKDPKS